MKKLIKIITLSLLFVLSASADDDKVKAESYIVSPLNGSIVSSPFKVIFGLKGMGVAPAGIDVAKTGHHHLLINIEELPDLSQPLPAADDVLHFGGGQTETVLDLPPGKHTLQLLLADYAHIPHSPPIISEKITVRVISRN